MSEAGPQEADKRATRRARWDARHAAGEPIESAAPNDQLVSIASSLEPGRALDLGCGDGVNAVWLARSGWTVTAVDFSEVGIGRGRERAAAAGVDVGWVVADLLDFEAEARAYDLVVLLFIHVPPGERRDILARAAAAVAPGGRLLLVGHDRSNLTDGVDGPQDPDVLFTAEEVAAELPGLRIESTAQVRRPGSAGRGPIDAVLVATRPAGPRPRFTLTAARPGARGPSCAIGRQTFGRRAVPARAVPATRTRCAPRRPNAHVGLGRRTMPLGTWQLLTPSACFWHMDADIPYSHPHHHHDAHRGWVRPGGRRGRWLEPFLLRLMAEGEVHGGALIARLNELCLAPEGVDVGMAYRTLREFEAEGLVDSEWVTNDGPPRRTYRLTDAGRRALDEWIAVMRERARLIDAFLDGSEYLDHGEGG